MAYTSIVSVGRRLTQRQMAALSKAVALAVIIGIIWLYLRGGGGAIIVDTCAQLLIAAVYQYSSLPSREPTPTIDGEVGQEDTTDASTELFANELSDQEDTIDTPDELSDQDDNAIESDSSPSSDDLPSAPRDTNIQAVATAVGWREDPVWYIKCLESLKESRNCEFVIAGIDGDAREDDQMVKIFQTV